MFDWNLGFKPNVLNGTIAQRESTSLTSKGSLVQSQLVPPYFQKKDPNAWHTYTLNLFPRLLSSWAIFIYLS